MTHLILIKNKKPQTQQEMLNTNPKKLLLMRYRVCNYCEEPFDIENKGIFYRCCK